MLGQEKELKGSMGQIATTMGGTRTSSRSFYAGAYPSRYQRMIKHFHLYANKYLLYEDPHENL